MKNSPSNQTSNFMNPSSSKQFFKRKHKNEYLKFPLEEKTQFNQELEKSTHNQSTSIEQTRKSQELKLNPFTALTELKSAEEQYEMMKKRLQVLKLKDQKNNHRYELNQRKMVLHNSIQKLTQLQRQKIKQWKCESEERKQYQRIMNLQQKIIRHKNIQSINERIHQNKYRDYEMRKKQAKNNQRRIQQISLEYLHTNKEKVEQIKQMESLSRISIQSYNKLKVSQFKQKKFKQTDTLKSKKEQRQDQIKKMMELEMQMVQKQSRSRVIFDKSSQKLKEMLNPQTNLKNSKLRLKQKKQGNLSFEHEVKDQIQNMLSKNLQVKTQKNESASATKQYSFSSQGRKNGFSLPEIKTARQNR